MSDLAERLLAAIEACESQLKNHSGTEEFRHWALHESPDMNEGLIVQLAMDGLRRCAADREIVQLHRFESHTGMDGWEFKYCLACGRGEPFEYPAAWPCQTLILLARGYGLEVEP